MSWTKTGIWPSSGLPPQWSKCRWQFAASLMSEICVRSPPAPRPAPPGADGSARQPRVGAHARVKQDHSLGVADRVAQAGLDPGYPRPGLLCGPDEVTEINTPHRDVSHPAILATGTRHDKEVIQHRACRP